MIPFIRDIMDKTYVALYTHQKNKKAKTWQDGLLKVLSTGTKAVLYDEKGSRLDALHLHASDVRPGEQLESDKYYIQVEEECAPLASQSLPAISRDGSSDSSHSLNAASQQEKDKNAQSNMCGGGASRRIVAGLKRKRNGFNPPRLVKPRHPEEPATGSVESYSPHHEQTLLSPRVQKLSSWNAAAQQSSSFEFLMNRSNMIHLPEQHARSLTVSTVPKIFASEGSPGMERMGDAEKEASCLMSPHVSNSNLTTLKKNSPWRVFGSLVSGSIGSSLSQKKEDLPLEKQEDVSSRQLQTEPQVSANLSQFCSEVGIKDNVYMPSALSISDIGIKSFSKKCDQRDQAEVRERFLAWDAEQLKADGPALKRSTAEIMALVQGYGGSSPKKAGPNVWESCSSNRNKAELFSKNELHFKEVEFLPSGTQTKQFSSLPASAFSEHSSSRESSVFRLFQTPAVTVASPFSQNHGDVGCVNAESHLCKKISSPGDSFLDHTMLQKVSNNMLSERNSRSSSSRNSLCFGDLSPVNCLVSSMSGQVSEHSGNLTICDKRLESQSKDIENIIQYQAVLENTVEHGENFILNNDMLENMAKHDENSTQISGVSENTSKHDENLKQKDEVFKNNMKEAPYSQDVALSLPAVSVSSVDPPFSEPCSIFKVGTRIKHEKDNVADLLPQGMRQLEASSQEWHGHHSKLLEHQGDDSKQVCKLLGTTSVVDRDKRNQSLSNSQNKHSIDSSQIKHFCASEKTDATSKEDDTELQSGCFDLSFSPLSQELSNDSMNDAEPAPIPPVLDKVEDHAVNLKKLQVMGFGIMVIKMLSLKLSVKSMKMEAQILFCKGKNILA
ncbi:uncharacterized protein LOC112575705 isoform X2 [Pomacea canaliculata]|uniref:uncharacterized protein LOC112575705 isoform X2 n=1 Tax=Pomacea canaliculata TaxID=400727 RepID=UPI000D736D54|nr:uncharacterized protein LOC112575705 isoform X2 [Pomacea canaliculata]